MTLARGGSSRRSFGPPGVDAPRPPIRGLVLRGQRPPASRCRTVFLEVEQDTHRTIVNSGWRSCPTRSGSTAKRSRSPKQPRKWPRGYRDPRWISLRAARAPGCDRPTPRAGPPQGGAMVNAGTRPLASVGGGDLLCHAPHLERRAFDEDHPSSSLVMRTGSVTRLRPRQRSRPGLQTRASSTQTCPLVIERVQRERVGSPAAGIRS